MAVCEGHGCTTNRSGAPHACPAHRHFLARRAVFSPYRVELPGGSGCGKAGGHCEASEVLNGLAAEGEHLSEHRKVRVMRTLRK